MKDYHLNDVVRLKSDQPQLALPRGSVGVVCSTWFAPELVFEVEFKTPDNSMARRALLCEEQLEPEFEVSEDSLEHCPAL